MVSDERLKEILDDLTAEEKEAVYRSVWAEKVKLDIASQLEDTEETLTDAQIDYAADRYVNGVYDCNASYWDNIQGVIDLARDFA